MSILTVGLEPNYAKRADQTEQCAKLKLPLPDDRSFLGKKCEREQGGEDNGRANENRVDARPHIKERDHLRDLMNDVRQTRNQAKADRADVDLWSTPKLK